MIIPNTDGGPVKNYLRLKIYPSGDQKNRIVLTIKDIEDETTLGRWQDADVQIND